MSNTRSIIDYAVSDNGKEAREALYAEIHDRISAHIEAKRIEVAQGMFATEEKSCDDMSHKYKKTEKKIKKLKEDISKLEELYTLIEESESDDDDEDKEMVGCEIEKKKKKLKKAEKKMKKLKESIEGGLNDEGEWEEEAEEDSEEE